MEFGKLFKWNNSICCRITGTSFQPSSFYQNKKNTEKATERTADYYFARILNGDASGDESSDEEESDNINKAKLHS